MTVLTPPEGRYSLDYVEIQNQDTNPVPVTLSEGAYGPSSATIIRPNDSTTYAAGDVVGTSPASVIEFANIGPTGGRVLIQDATFLCSGSSVPSTLGSLRLHLYNAAPTAITDNSPYNLPVGDRTKYLGWFELPVPQDLGDTIWSQTDYIGKIVKLTTSSLYGILETRNSCTPAPLLSFTLGINVLEASR